MLCRRYGEQSPSAGRRMRDGQIPALCPDKRHCCGPRVACELPRGRRLGAQPDFVRQGRGARGREPETEETARMAILLRRPGASAISGPTVICRDGDRRGSLPDACPQLDELPLTGARSSPRRQLVRAAPSLTPRSCREVPRTYGFLRTRIEGGSLGEYNHWAAQGPLAACPRSWNLLTRIPTCRAQDSRHHFHV